MESCFNPVYKRYWRSHYLEGVEFLTAKLANCAFSHHLHNSYTISVVEKGILPLVFKTGFVSLEPGHFMIIGPEVPQRLDLTGKEDLCHYRTVFINEEIVEAVFQKQFKDQRSSISLVRSQRFFEDFVDIQVGLEKGSRQEAASLLDLAFNLLPQIRENPLEKSGTVSRQVVAVKEFIHQNYFHPLTIDELSEVAGLSPAYMMRRFKAEIGMSPYAYMIQLKISRAKQMLARGDSLLSIAYELGFFDQSHFVKTFRKVLGVSPSRYASG